MTLRQPARRSALGPIGIGSTTLAVIGPLLAFLGLLKPFTGFSLFALGGLTSILLGTIGLVGLVRGRRVPPGGLLAMAVGTAFVVLAVRAAGAPRINDFTTDVSDPPAFRVAATLPANTGRDLAYPRAFTVVQQECCADLRPARLAAEPADAFARAQAVAERTSAWRITSVDPDSGTLEAVATSRLFRFRDDIVIRVRGLDGGGSRIDIRSKSRDGQSDLGVNATRIRTFVAAVEQSEE